MASYEGIFHQFAVGNPPLIPANRIQDALRAAGKRDTSTAMQMLQMAGGSENPGVTFEQFTTLASAGEAPSMDMNAMEASGYGQQGSQQQAQQPDAMDDSADPRVTEFLRVLEEYRLKCEGEGNYEEASRCTDQLAAIRKAEEDRRLRALRAKHVQEKQEVAAAHTVQYAQFNESWERYLAEYDAMAAVYVSQMQERHGGRTREFQAGLHAELVKKPVKAGREVLEWRNREAQLVKQRLYTEAARVKAVADELERKERAKLDEERLQVFRAREEKFRSAQRAELSALMKRIDMKRQEHTKQWEADNKRLLQRNRNVMAVLEQRQAAEEGKKKEAIRLELQPPRVKPFAPSKIDSGPSVHSTARAGRGAGRGLADSLVSTMDAEQQAAVAAMGKDGERVAQALQFSTSQGGGQGGQQGGGGLGMKSPGGARQLIMRAGGARR